MMTTASSVGVCHGEKLTSERRAKAAKRQHSARSAQDKRAGALQRKIMAREDCALCRGTGWKLVARKDGTPGNLAVACECGMEERAGVVMERARIPKRYEHCDFESYVVDLADGKTWTAQHDQSLKNAKLTVQGFLGS